MGKETAPPTRIGPGRSCTECRRRKIRCNQHRPCGRCSRLGHECVYAPIAEPNKASADQLLSRLTSIESTLQRIEASIPSQSTNASPRETQVNPSGVDVWSTEADEPGHRVEDGEFVSEEGETRYVSSGVWTRLNDRTNSAGVLQQTGSQVTDTDTSPKSIVQMELTFPFSLNPGMADTQSLHPEELRIAALWRVFVDSVDPILKVVHVPSTQQQLAHACQDLAATPPAFESLMFAIYYGAVCSMQWSVSYETIPRDERQTILDRYRAGLEQALTKAMVMTAPNVTTLQALAIYLTCARHIMDEAYVWTMTGLLIRLAMKLSLHRDPASLTISLFACEMRRRLWWTIVVLDILTSESYGTDPLISEGMYNTRLPASLDDSDLSIDMTALPSVGRPSLDLLFSFMRFERTTAVHKAIQPMRSTAGVTGSSKPTIKETNDMIDNLHTRLHEQYLVNCDATVPIVFFAKSVTDLVIAKVRLGLNFPHRTQLSSIPSDQLKPLISTATDSIDLTQELRSNKRYSHWAWFLSKHIEWDAVAALLQMLGTVTNVENVRHIWETTEAFFHHWFDETCKDDHRWRRLQVLRRDAATKQGFEVSHIDTEIPYLAEPSRVGLTSQDTQGSNSDMISSGERLDQQSSRAGGLAHEHAEDATIWNFDDTLYPARSAVDLDVYHVDGGVASAYFRLQFSCTE